MIPAEVTLGGTDWTTSLWPKGGAYVVPLKTLDPPAEQGDVGDTVTIELAIDAD